jgi:hypothetical protein
MDKEKRRISNERYRQTEKYKDYNKEWNKNNPEKVKLKYRKYNKTLKGILNWLKKRDRRSFGFVNKELTLDLLKEINERDKICPYCKKEFETDLARQDIHYDHINPFKQLNENNIVRCCRKCNQSKMNADLLQWMKFKGYEITEDIKQIYLKAYL